MYALHIVILLTAIMCQISAKTTIQNNSLTYECTKNDTIIITGNNTLYGSIYAVGTGNDGSNLMCTVNKDVQASVVIFTVRNCNVNLQVNITVMNDEQKTTDDMVLGGKHVAMYALKCSNVRPGGLNITKVINITESDKLNISQKYQKEVNMAMKITGKGNKTLGTNPTVVIGEEIQLIIEGNGGFSFLASSCIATDGNTNHVHSRNLIVNGTTQDTSVISTFSEYGDENRTELRASLFAFHFLHTNTVSIICTITVCQDDDSSCPFKPHDSSRRRKRSAQIEPHTNTLETSFRVVDSYTTLVDKTDESNTSGSSTGQMSVTASLILFAAFGFTRILP